MPSIYIRVDEKALEDNVNRILGKKVEKIYYTETRNEVAGIYASAVEKYVPSKTGRLHSSARVRDGEIRYSAKAKRKRGNYDYAGVQYYSNDSTWNRHTPNTYSHWNRHLTSAERQNFYQEVAKIIAEKMNNG